VSHPANEFPIATVGALIVNGRGDLLMMRTHKWSHCWGIPGGKIKRGETCEEALRREVREETALEITDIRWVMVQDSIEPPEFERSAHFLLLNYIVNCADAQPRVVLNDEAEEFRWVTVRQARALRLNQPTRVLIDEALRLGFIRDES
jgi:ADP-ribose pyrophosphatase YjhB (NUDIX family)